MHCINRDNVIIMRYYRSFSCLQESDDFTDVDEALQEMQILFTHKIYLMHIQQNHDTTGK